MNVKKILATILFSLGLFPSAVFASCGATGSTVIYVNGILTNKRDAGDDLYLLKTNFKEKTGRDDVRFLTGYNPSHLAGAGDLIQATSQLFNFSISDFDLNTILLDIQPKIKTQKILFVGHSQGTFYANEVYDYLLKNGESKDSVGVYNIATPASYVSSGGIYLGESLLSATKSRQE